MDAYYLKKAAPFLRVTVLEQKFCGYGASGRNGGWLYNGIAGRDRYAELLGHEAAVRLQKAMNDTVDEVVRVAEEEGIEADLHKGGMLEVATTPAQLARLKAFHAHEVSYGEKDRELYDAGGTAERIRVAGAVGSTWTPHGARLHPVKLVKGPAAAVEALGPTSGSGAVTATSRRGRRGSRIGWPGGAERSAGRARPGCACRRPSPPGHAR